MQTNTITEPTIYGACDLDLLLAASPTEYVPRRSTFKLIELLEAPTLPKITSAVNITLICHLTTVHPTNNNILLYCVCYYDRSLAGRQKTLTFYLKVPPTHPYINIFGDYQLLLHFHWA
ncbi:hypothetical protein MOSE0_J02124 [Monosporozyma servazzii]